MFRKYRVLVLEGGTPLLNMPYEFYQVATLHSGYLNMKSQKDYKKRKEEQEMKDFIRNNAPKG